MAELVRQHRVIPPLVSPPEELSSGSQGLIRHFRLFSLLLLPLLSMEMRKRSVCLFGSFLLSVEVVYFWVGR